MRKFLDYDNWSGKTLRAGSMFCWGRDHLGFLTADAKLPATVISNSEQNEAVLPDDALARC